MSESTTTATQKAPLKHGLNAKSLGRLFPFHIMFDKECNIIQAGPVSLSFGLFHDQRIILIFLSRVVCVCVCVCVCVSCAVFNV